MMVIIITSQRFFKIV